MRSLGAIVVGIGAYRYPREQFPLLNYAPSDAEEFQKYLATCWPKPDDATLLGIPEGDATVERVADAFAALMAAGPLDLQIVFLSGHGLVEHQNAAFLLQPPSDSNTLSLLDCAALDRLISSVPARRTILILDCCYAEAITRGMSFFSALGEDDARLFIASSRGDQRTWEDERVGHGIFAAHLLDLLKTGNSAKLKGVRDQLDVDAELFPVLCDQVPLYVFEHKQQRQEPVKGGVSTHVVTLPVARSARRFKDRTALGTALRRLRQIASGAAAAVAVFLFFAYTLAYYAQADRNGDVYLYHGTKWLAPAFNLVSTVRTDTGISFAELSEDAASRYAVQAGETFGFWTQISRQGYRAWYDTVRPSLDPAAAERYDVLLATDAMRPVYRLNDESRPSQIAFAAWALLDNSDLNQLDTLFRRLLGADRTAPQLTHFSASDLDFTIMDLTQRQLASYASALRATAAVDPDRTFISYLGFLKANQIWLAHSSPEQHGEEAQRRAAEDVADVLAVIARARLDRTEPALDQSMLSQLNELGALGYSDLVHLALSRAVETPEDRKAGVSKALLAFHGDSSEPAEAGAIRQLKDLLDSSPASKAVVEEIYKRFVKFGGAEQSDLTGFLIAAGDKKALPTSLIAMLLDKARRAVERHGDEFIDTEYARILAHAMSDVPADSRPLVYRLIETVSSRVTPLASSTAEMYLALARQGLETPAMLQQIVTQASAAAPYKPEKPNLVSEPLPGLSIVVGHGPWLEALAVLGLSRTLPQDAIRVLESHANDPSLHDTVVRAIANQPAWLDEECWKTRCSGILGAFPRDGARRQLISDVLSERLARLPRNEFLIVLEKLRMERASEMEPEVRIAITLSTINAQLARVRTIPIGSRLFE